MTRPRVERVIDREAQDIIDRSLRILHNLSASLMSVNNGPREPIRHPSQELIEVVGRELNLLENIIAPYIRPMYVMQQEPVTDEELETIRNMTGTINNFPGW